MSPILPNRILLRGGRLIDPAREVDEACDLLVAEGEVDAIEPPGRLGAPDGARVIDATGCWVVPGLIDPHVHLRDPGFPEKETIATGLRAAAAGGFTAVAAMANTSPVNDSPEVTRYMLEHAATVHAARLVPVSAVTRSLGGREMVDFAAMVGGRCAVCFPTMEFRSTIRPCWPVRWSKSRGSASRFHCTRRTAASPPTARSTRARSPSASAWPACRRRPKPSAFGVTWRSRSAPQAPVHIAHVSTALSLDLIRAARKRGAQITCEATPHHFSLDDRAVLRWGPNAKMAPPLRSIHDVEAVVAAIADGTIDMIATDHAPHDPHSKRMERLAGLFKSGNDCGRLPESEVEALTQAANGVVGLETALGLALELVHRGVISPARMVEMMSLRSRTVY